MATAQGFLGGDGCRGRIGIVVPSVNTVMEPWAQRAVPAGVSVHFSRMFKSDLMTSGTLRTRRLAGEQHPMRRGVVLHLLARAVVVLPRALRVKITLLSKE